MIRAISLLIPLLGTCCLTAGCPGRERDDLAQIRQKAEESIPPFDPTYFKDPERKHLAVFFDVVDGELTLSARSAEIRPGRPPHRSTSGGPVLVVYKDARGEELGRYRVEDPTTVRSCDMDEGPAAGVMPIESWTVEILLPHDTAIATVEIGPVDGTLTPFDVSAQVKRAVAPPPIRRTVE